MVLERILLQTIKFDLQVEHPYQFLLKYAKQLKGKGTELFKNEFPFWNQVFIIWWHSDYASHEASREVCCVVYADIAYADNSIL